MTEAELIQLIKAGENAQVEFKKSTNDITKDVYDTVCSFSNRDGGTIIFGVKDDGEILGINPDAVNRIKKDFVTTIHNTQKISPALFIKPEDYVVDGKNLLVVHVPSCNQVCRHQGRIYDRNHEADIDITEDFDLVYQLYSRKKDTCFLNKVTRFQLEDLRADLIDRGREMASMRKAAHPWKNMSDEALLRSAGLILKDEEKQIEGITLAGILLFGKDSTIMSVLPQHKTDAILRVEKVDRYDDRDVIITNLLETYDRLTFFGQRYLSDPFIQEGFLSVSARDRILREIISNSLAHRDYSSGYVAKFVIERNRVYTENANRSHGQGTLNISTFEPYSKNPAIAKVFREIGLADELGSGMRNTYKYTKLYSGGTPKFIEGDVFRIIIPLTPVVFEQVGPQRVALNESQDKPQVEEENKAQLVGTPQDKPQVEKENKDQLVGTPQDKPQVEEENKAQLVDTPQVENMNQTQMGQLIPEKKKDAVEGPMSVRTQILAFCAGTPRSKAEIMEHVGYKDKKFFTKKFMIPLLDSNALQMTIPDKPHSKSQRYISSDTKQNRKS